MYNELRSPDAGDGEEAEGDGTFVDRDRSVGNEPVGNEPAGNEPAGNEPAGVEQLGDGAAGDEAAPCDAGGDDAGGDEAAASDAAADEAVGDEAVGDEAVGDEAAGDEPEGDLGAAPIGRARRGAVSSMVLAAGLAIEEVVFGREKNLPALVQEASEPDPEDPLTVELDHEDVRKSRVILRDAPRP